MINKEQAIEVRDYVLTAIDYLMKAINITDPNANDPAEEALRKAIGLAVGEIDIEVLCKLYKVYPEINDLRIKGIL